MAGRRARVREAWSEGGKASVEVLGPSGLSKDEVEKCRASYRRKLERSGKTQRRAGLMSCVSRSLTPWQTHNFAAGRAKLPKRSLIAITTPFPFNRCLALGKVKKIGNIAPTTTVNWFGGQIMPHKSAPKEGVGVGGPRRLTARLLRAATTQPGSHVG